MAKKTKRKAYYLKMYREWMEAGRLPENGLCSCFSSSNLKFLLFVPTEAELDKMEIEGEETYYWAFGEERNRSDNIYTRKFTTLRQVILLFMAAMNNEL